MMMSVQYKYQKRVFLGQKLDFFNQKMSKMVKLFLKIPSSDCWIYLGVKG